MKIPDFSPKWIDWDAVKGGTEETAWLVDRDRKFENMLSISNDIIPMFSMLRSANCLFRASPEILKEYPLSALWYVSLACFSQKTLANIKAGPSLFGMGVTAKTFVDNMSDKNKIARMVSGEKCRPIWGDSKNLEGFVSWINSEIDDLYSDGFRSPEVALSHVCMILGGRVIGKGQNEGGNDAVLLVKQHLVKSFFVDFSVEKKFQGIDSWVSHEAGSPLDAVVALRLGGVLVVDFIGGGNRPDITVKSNSGDVFVVGEIKGRKDLSNLWESWMPTIEGHLNTWSHEYPSAKKIFIGTLVNDQMVDGFSVRGTLRSGLKGFYDGGKLSSVFNIAKIDEGDHVSVKHFEEFLSYLKDLVLHLSIK